MSIDDLIPLLQRWSELGTAIQEQGVEVLDDIGTAHEQNPNALKHFADFLDRCAAAGVEDAGQWAEDIRDSLAAEERA